MNTTNKLLDMYMQAMHVETLAAAAKKLGVSRPALSNWQTGVSHAQPELVAIMAKACGLDAEEWVLRVQADRELVPARKQVWLRVAERLAATAALIAITFGIAVYTPKASATQVTHHFAESRDYVYYVKYKNDGVQSGGLAHYAPALAHNPLRNRLVALTRRPRVRSRCSCAIWTQ